MTANERDVLIVRSSSEWSALYVDGKLDRVGDHYLAEDRILELFGVKMEWSEDFLRGGDSRDSVAKTVDELRAYTAEREQRERQAAELRRQADELCKRADALVGGPDA